MNQGVFVSSYSAVRHQGTTDLLYWPSSSTPEGCYCRQCSRYVAVDATVNGFAVSILMQYTDLFSATPANSSHSSRISRRGRTDRRRVKPPFPYFVHIHTPIDSIAGSPLARLKYLALVEQGNVPLPRNADGNRGSGQDPLMGLVRSHNIGRVHCSGDSVARIARCRCQIIRQMQVLQE
jgi:hypothetical protein